MNLTPETRAVLEELERRKAAKDDLCDSCDGSGRSANDAEAQPLACGHCLGQGVLLTAEEYEVLMGLSEPDILDAAIIH